MIASAPSKFHFKSKQIKATRKNFLLGDGDLSTLSGRYSRVSRQPEFGFLTKLAPIRSDPSIWTTYRWSRPAVRFGIFRSVQRDLDFFSTTILARTGADNNARRRRPAVRTLSRLHLCVDDDVHAATGAVHGRLHRRRPGSGWLATAACRAGHTRTHAATYGRRRRRRPGVTKVRNRPVRQP